MVLSLKVIKKIIRWLKFHLLLKNQYKNRFGSPKLCNNLDHIIHDSKFESDTCLLLEKFFPKKNILTPSQHKLSTKFDFIIRNFAIIEPHGVWNGSDYFTYYKNRKDLAEKQKLDLPIVIIPSYSDLSLFENTLMVENNPNTAIKKFQLEMLEKYRSNESPSWNFTSSITNISKRWKNISLISWIIISIQTGYILFFI